MDRPHADLEGVAPADLPPEGVGQQLVSEADAEQRPGWAPHPGTNGRFLHRQPWVDVLLPNVHLAAEDDQSVEAGQIGDPLAVTDSDDNELQSRCDQVVAQGVHPPARLVLPHEDPSHHPTLGDQRATAARSRLTVSLGETLYRTSARVPRSSTRKAERTMPRYFLPYIDFSAHTP